MSKFELVAVRKAAFNNLLERNEFANDIEAISQFKHYASGGEDGQSTCFALVESDTGKTVGFLAYQLVPEDLTTRLIAYINVEFVYLHPRLRRQGNSKLFIDHITDDVSVWIPCLQAEYRDQYIDVISSSSPKSDDGVGFVKALDRQLQIVVSSIPVRDFPVEFQSAASAADNV